jgi:hypothetical protein
VVVWATSIGAPGAGLLYQASRLRGIAAAAGFKQPPPPTSEPGLIA